MTNDEEKSVLPDNGQFNVHLDNTNYVIAYYAQIFIRSAFKTAAEMTVARCGLNKKVVNVPIVFDKFDEKKVDLRPTVVVAFAMGYGK